MQVKNKAQRTGDSRVGAPAPLPPWDGGETVGPQVPRAAGTGGVDKQGNIVCKKTSGFQVPSKLKSSSSI